MPPKRRTTRARTTAPRRRTTVSRKKVRRIRAPKGGPLGARIGARLALIVVNRMQDHDSVVRSRKDAAILRATHEGCAKCGGNGQIFTKGKHGEFTGSKPCPAKPTRTKVSRFAVWKASRFSAQKRTGLVGWTCPCNKREKPRYRDAKEATKALRTHERQKHGGKSVGGTWYAQQTEAAALAPSRPAPAPGKASAKAAA